MMSRIDISFGRLDVVINNAGIARDNLLIKQTEKEWDAIINTNLTGCFHVMRASVPLLISSGGGHILNISSYSGMKGRAGQVAYSASKAALFGLSLAAARELAEFNIRVNAVLPGYMMTEMGSKAFMASEKAKDESILHSLSNPSKVSQSIFSLAEMSYITGQVLNLDSRVV
jgi:3-oxoacyl-[acyl-carrier protein] reductase